MVLHFRVELVLESVIHREEFSIILTEFRRKEWDMIFEITHSG